MKNENKIVYMLYDWTDEIVKLLTYDKDQIYIKIGKDAMNDEIIDNYKIIEINLNEVEEWLSGKNTKQIMI